MSSSEAGSRKEYLKQWYQENKARINEARRNPEIGYYVSAKKYYDANKKQIQLRQSKNEGRQQRRNDRKRQAGTNVRTGQRQRSNLYDSYAAALIKHEGSDKTLQTKKVEVLRYRINNILKHTDSAK
jgi:hypothetical protein